MHYRTMPAKWRMMMVAALIALVSALGLTLAGPAHANSPSAQRVVNDTPYQIGVQWHTSWNTTVWFNVPGYQWQGEGNGNYSYEPRYIHLGAGYCINYYYWVWGQNPGPTNTACGGTAGGWLNVYFGDGYNVSYDTHVKGVFAEYGP